MIINSHALKMSNFFNSKSFKFISLLPFNGKRKKKSEKGYIEAMSLYAGKMGILMKVGWFVKIHLIFQVHLYFTKFRK